MTWGMPIIPSTRPMFREMKFQEVVLSARLTFWMSSPKRAVASFMGPIGSQPVREITTTYRVATITTSRLVLKIWM